MKCKNGCNNERVSFSVFCHDCLIGKQPLTLEQRISDLEEYTLTLKTWIGRIEKQLPQPPPPPDKEIHRCIAMEHHSLKIEKHSSTEGGWYMIYGNHFAYLIRCCPFCKMELY